MKMDIIVADDERVIRQAIAKLLEASDYSVRAAKNGEEALTIGTAAFAAEPAELTVRGRSGQVTCRHFPFPLF